MTILPVDDSPVSGSLLTAVLSHAHHQVRAAGEHV